MGSRKYSYLAAGITAVILCFPPAAHADGTEALGAPSITIAGGSGIAAGGVGLAASQPGTIEIDVPEDAAVEQVLVYWSCQYQSSGDDQIRVGGRMVQGTSIGGPRLFFSTVFSQTYRADITDLGLVGPGPNAVTVSGLECGNAWENSGAGILAIYSKPSAPSATIGLRDGQDLAFCRFEPPLNTTAEQVFIFTPAVTDRLARLWLFAASVHGLDNGVRPNRIRLVVAGKETYINDLLDSTDGAAWDTVSLDVAVPAGAGEVRVQVLSQDAMQGCPDSPKPASLNWLAAALAVPEAAMGTCTQGFWKNHLSVWPVTTLTLGGDHDESKSYSQEDLLEILRMPTRGDASLVLARQLIAAKLNVAAGSDASIVATIDQADSLLGSYEGKLPYQVRAGDPRRPEMIQLAEELDAYNNGVCPAGGPARETPRAPKTRGHKERASGAYGASR